MSGDIPQRDKADFDGPKYNFVGGKLYVLLIHDERQKTHDLIMDGVDMEEKSEIRIKNDLKQLEQTLLRFGNVMTKKIPIKGETTITALKKELKTIADGIPTDVGALLCVFLGFGGSEYVYLGREDGKVKKMDFADIVEQFNGENCENLVMGPKLFFVQAEAIDPVKPASSTFSSGTDQKELVKIPIHADIFVYFSSALAGKIWNEVPVNDGDEKEVMSRFVKLLCGEIRRLTGEVDIQKMVIRINSQIDNATFPDDKKPKDDADLLPLTTSQLTKDVFLTDFIPNKVLCEGEVLLKGWSQNGMK